MMIPADQIAHVRLRNGFTAMIKGMVSIDRASMLQGMHRESDYELWNQDGTWSYRSVAHPLDIVAIFTKRGEVIALNTAKQPVA